jgi:DNA-binding Xre family transcriptional regulator
MCINPKYNIRRRLLEMEGRLLINKYQLCIFADVGERTLDKYTEVNMGDAYSIPSDKLFKIADFFDCQPAELLNYK